MLKKLYIKLVTRNENVRATYTRYKKLHPQQMAKQSHRFVKSVLL